MKEANEGYRKIWRVLGAAPPSRIEHQDWGRNIYLHQVHPYLLFCHATKSPPLLGGPEITQCQLS